MIKLILSLANLEKNMDIGYTIQFFYKCILYKILYSEKTNNNCKNQN